MAFREIRHLKEKLTKWGSRSETSLSGITGVPQSDDELHGPDHGKAAWPSPWQNCIVLTLTKLHDPDPGIAT